MGLSPQNTKLAIKTLQKIAPKLPLVYASWNQEDSVSKMSEVIVVSDEYKGNSAAVFIKTLKEDEYKDVFEKVKLTIENTSFCWQPKSDNLPQGLSHIGRS